jgi:hypothetical protein
VVREGVGAGGKMTEALYAHMNNKIKKKIKKNPRNSGSEFFDKDSNSVMR